MNSLIGLGSMFVSCLLDDDIVRNSEVICLRKVSQLNVAAIVHGVCLLFIRQHWSVGIQCLSTNYWS